jgi:hypothetical protein
MIRVRTFLKYAGIHLEEAEAALRKDCPDVVSARCRDAAIAMTKAIAASLPRTGKDFLSMDKDALAKVISDLAETKGEACRIAKTICELKESSDCLSKTEAEETFFTAGETLKSVHRLCLGQ